MKKIFSTYAYSEVNADVMKLKVYQVAVSQSVFCTNLTTVFRTSDGTPTETDFLIGPTIGAGSIVDATYPCVVIEFSNVLKFSPSADDGDDCVAATEYSQNVCQNGATSTLIDGKLLVVMKLVM